MHEHLIYHAPERRRSIPARIVARSRGHPGRPSRASSTSRRRGETSSRYATHPAPRLVTAVGTAWAQPLPHQAELINRVVSTYPRGYLFADEVGLGKTIEAGMVLRELFLSGQAQKALLWSRRL